MNNTKQIIDNHDKRILCPSEHIDCTADDTAINIKHATADKITHAHSAETASNYQFSTKPPSHVKTIALVKRTSDLQKTTQDKIQKPHCIIPTCKTQKLYRTQKKYLDS